MSNTKRLVARVRVRMAVFFHGASPCIASTSYGEGIVPGLIYEETGREAKQKARARPG